MVFACKNPFGAPPLETLFVKGDDRRNMLSFTPPKTLPKGRNGVSLNRCTKPVALMRYLVNRFCKPGEMVLDLLAGLGPLTEAAVLEGRHCVTIERDNAQRQFIIDRLSRVYSNKEREDTEVATDGTVRDYKTTITYGPNGKVVEKSKKTVPQPQAEEPGDGSLAEAETEIASSAQLD
jgi:DNA methylase